MLTDIQCTVVLRTWGINHWYAITIKGYEVRILSPYRTGCSNHHDIVYSALIEFQAKNGTQIQSDH